MATSAKNSGGVAYNVQAAVDTEAHPIVTHEVTNQGHDRDQLASMAFAAREALDRLYVCPAGDRLSYRYTTE